MLTDDLYEIYARYSREIEEALSVYGQRRAYKAAAKLRAEEFSTNVIYVYGDAGIGKTRFVNNFIAQALGYAAQHGQHWQIYHAATGNPLDDWQGEEVVLLDDLRASAMDANDWLLLDPHNASPARARYRNKGEVAPRLILITATIQPGEFFFYPSKKGEVNEALDQFIRRLALIVQVFQVDDEIRYLVQNTGRVEPYTHAIKRTDTGLPLGSNLNGQELTLTYGAEHEVEHSAESAVASLMLGRPGHSREVPFASTDEWPALETLAHFESAGHGSLLSLPVAAMAAA